MGNTSSSLARAAVRAVAVAGFAVLALAPLAGCQLQPSVSTNRLLRHQELVESDGLAPANLVDALKARCCPPEHWRKLPLQRTALYTHQQWKSPSGLTGVGVAYIRMPLPLSAKAIIWFAKGEYQKKDKDGNGRQLGQWTDSIGREWFEAENSKYHVRGCVMTRGFEAWIIYSGYKCTADPRADELNLAERAQEKILPLTTDYPSPPSMPTASAD